MHMTKNRNLVTVLDQNVTFFRQTLFLSNLENASKKSLWVSANLSFFYVKKAPLHVNKARHMNTPVKYIVYMQITQYATVLSI